MLEVRNITFGHALSFEKEGALGRVFSVVVLKSSFDLASGVLRPSKDPLGLVLADRYFGEPETSSLRIEGDLVLRKPGTDLWITGDALSPSGKPERQWEAGVELGPLAHRYRLSGPRVWSHDEAGWRLGDPEPVREVALRYEQAFGGTRHPSSGEPLPFPGNPVGLGFHDVERLDTARTYPAPAILSASSEYTEIKHCPEPAPLGPLNRWWKPRYRFAGTFDAEWERSWRGRPGAFPCLPKDFDERFYNAAHPLFVTDSHLRGDEALSLTGFGERAEVSARLPGWRFEAVLQGGAEAGRVERLALDTVHVDLERRQVHLVWRLTLPADLDAARAMLRFAEEE